MKYEAGNRFNPDTYIKTEVDSASVTVKVYGELEGVEVDFNSGDIPEITSLSVTENGTYEAPEGTAYDPVTVEVPNSYTAADEGKVVDQGALVSQTSRTVTTNDTYDTTTNNEVVVAVPGPSGSINITQNDTYDVTQYASAVVNVPSGSDPQMTAYLDGSITELEVPEGITQTRQYIIQACLNITKVILPSTITNIQSYTLYGSGALAEDVTLVCKAVTPPALAAINAIYISSSNAPGVIQVPAESVTAYQSAQYWSTFAARIEAIPST